MNFAIVTFNEEDCACIMASLAEYGTCFDETGNKLRELDFKEVPMPDDEDGEARFVMKLTPWGTGIREYEFLQLGVMVALLTSVDADFTLEFEETYEV